VLSTRTKSNATRLTDVVRKASWRYLWYRSVVELAGRVPWRRWSVQKRANELGIRTISCGNADELSRAIEKATNDRSLGIAINFDQVLRAAHLDRFSLGVVNCHASKLPRDRGISPALWAFARGDSTLWVTLYRVDPGLDTGPIYEQFEVPVQKSDSAFSAYERVCMMGGERLSRLATGILEGTAVTRAQEGPLDAPLSWPDERFSASLAASRRKLLKMRDLLRLALHV
jgi:methionyl-tRNA formyltransferase